MKRKSPGLVAGSIAALSLMVVACSVGSDLMREGQKMVACEIAVKEIICKPRL